MIVSPNSRKSKSEFLLLLFNDIVVFCKVGRGDGDATTSRDQVDDTKKGDSGGGIEEAKHKGKEKKRDSGPDNHQPLSYVFHVDVKDCEASSVEDNQRMQNAFKFLHPQRHLCIVCSTPQEKQKWLSELNDAIRNALTKE